MLCPSCRKLLPPSDRFCAYCGADLGWRLLPGVTVPRLRLPPRWQITGGLAAAVGLVAGTVVAVPFASLWLGALVGALTLGASAMFADVIAGSIPDRASAERFAQGLGVLGGVLVLPGGLIIGPAVALWYGAPDSPRAFGALLAAGLFLGLICAAGGALVGAASGVITGVFAGRLGQALLRRQGALLGAAAAWSAAAVLGGLFAGDFAARIIGASERGGALAGLLLQVVISVYLLPLARRVQRRWRAWFTGRP
jgi:hypothetical protein